jgi:hypothetical protein
MRIAVLAVIVAACDQGRTAPAPPPPQPPLVIPSARPRTCDEARPDYTEMLRAQQAVFASALAAKHLSPAELEKIWIPSEQQPGTVVALTIKHHSKPRRVIASGVYDRAENDPPTVELVTDIAGQVWSVNKQLRPTSQTTIDVEACQWGCFGWSPHGDERVPEYGRDAWLLRDGQSYTGELLVDYAGPRIDFKPNHTDCPPPA